MTTGQWTAVCGGSQCTPQSVAYVYPAHTATHQVFLCPRFFTLPPGRFNNSKAGTLINQFTRFNDVLGTRDWAFGIDQLQSLALNNHTLARENADSIEAFVEDEG